MFDHYLPRALRDLSNRVREAQERAERNQREIDLLLKYGTADRAALSMLALLGLCDYTERVDKMDAYRDYRAEMDADPYPERKLPRKLKIPVLR